VAESDDQPGEEGATSEQTGDTAEDEPVVSPPAVEDDGPHPSEGLQIRGEVTAVERVDADVVPAAYPAGVATNRALAVNVHIGGPDDVTLVVYFAVPRSGVDDRLDRLLALAELPPDRASELVGRSLLVTVEDGYYVPVVPGEPLRGSDRAVYGIALGLLPSLLVGLIGIFAPGSDVIASTPFVLAWLVGTFLLLPVSVYVDALHLRSTTNWTGTPRIWTVLSVIPPINVLAVPLYLVARENAQQIV